MHPSSIEGDAPRLPWLMDTGWSRFQGVYRHGGVRWQGVGAIQTLLKLLRSKEIFRSPLISHSTNITTAELTYRVHRQCHESGGWRARAELNIIRRVMKGRDDGSVSEWLVYASIAGLSGPFHNKFRHRWWKQKGHGQTLWVMWGSRYHCENANIQTPPHGWRWI